MPYVCCVPGCRGNYKNGPKVHSFRFPTDEATSNKWVEAIRRKNFIPSKCSRVCEVHFAKECIIKSATATDSKTGETVTVNYKVPRLKPGAVPTQIPNCHFSYSNFEEFVGVLNLLQLSKDWFKIQDLQKVTLFKLKYSPGPVITYSIVINNDLKVETFLYNCEIQIPQNGISPDIKTPFSSNNIKEVKDLLLYIDKNCEEKCEPKNRENNTILKHISNLLDSFVSNMEDCFQNDYSALAFLSEQLKLHTVNKGRYQYTNTTMILVSILQTISPQAYKYLRHFGVLILPHPDTIRSVCGSLLPDSTFEDNNISFSYAKNLFKSLSDTEKNIILLMEEIHIKPFYDYNTGYIVGTTCLANSAIVFTISSVTSRLKEVVHISPISKIDHLQLFSLIKTVITKLEDIGYKVFCVVSDNNAVNSKAMSHFSDKKKLSIVYPHPIDKNRPLFYLFDSVHLLKCVSNDWLNSKPDQTLYYPNLDSGVEKSAAFQSLKRLYQLEHNQMLKGVSVIALYPSNMERQNVSLPLQVFNPFIEQALIQFGSKIDKSKDTADFINIIVRWWKIVNVKTHLMGKCLNNEYQKPIMSETFSTDTNYLFLNQMLNWLENWKTQPFSNKLSNETHTALSHTIYGMIEIIKYCFSELDMDYVLLGKCQTDDLDNKFGSYQQLSGGQYHSSVRQLYESEKKLTIHSLLTVKSYTFGNIDIMQFCEDLDEVDEKYAFNSDIIILENDLDIVSDDEMPVITYLAGYCSYILQKKLQCEICKKIFIYDNEFVVEDNFILIKNLIRGKLVYPQEVIVGIVLYAYLIFKKILDEFEETFLTIDNKRAFLTQFILKFILDNGHVSVDHTCAIHTMTLTFLLIFLPTILSISSQENGKFLNLQQDYSNNLNEERRLHKKRKPQNQNQGPCSYGGYKNAPDGTGRTFFDFQLVNVGYTNTNNYNLNCGGGGGGVLAPLGNKPLLAGGLAPVNDHKPLGGHKPGHGLFGNHNGGGHLGNQHGGNQNGGFNSHFSGGGGQGLFANRPGLAGVFGNRPLQGLFGQSQSQSQSQSGYFGYGRNAENALYDRRSISNTDLQNNAQISATQRVGSRNFRFPI